MADLRNTDTGRRRILQDQHRRLDHIERRMTEVENAFRRHDEQDKRMHGEVMSALELYRFAGFGVRTIKWLAVVGAAMVGIIGFLRGWGK